MMLTIETEETRRAFDAAAPVYDAENEGLAGIQRIRSITRQLYLEYFPPAANVLELNCGTGNDAVFLAQQGMRILVTDLSPHMLEQVRRKIADEHLEHAVESRLLGFEQLGTLRGMHFDGAFSNMGGLNCTDKLNSIAEEIGALVKPGGYFIATVMPSFCLWETATFLCRLQWSQAFRRQSRNGIIANVHGGSVRTYYHSPRKFRSAFAPCFEHMKTIGLAVFMPPPNHVRAYRLLGRNIRVLETLDSMLNEVAPFSSIGDHYVTVLRRKRT